MYVFMYSFMHAFTLASICACQTTSHKILLTSLTSIKALKEWLWSSSVHKWCMCRWRRSSLALLCTHRKWPMNSHMTVDTYSDRLVQICITSMMDTESNAACHNAYWPIVQILTVKCGMPIKHHSPGSVLLDELLELSQTSTSLKWIENANPRRARLATAEMNSWFSISHDSKNS